jgi:hypothetical protein
VPHPGYQRLDRSVANLDLALRAKAIADQIPPRLDQVQLQEGLFVDQLTRSSVRPVKSI